MPVHDIIFVWSRFRVMSFWRFFGLILGILHGVNPKGSTTCNGNSQSKEHVFPDDTKACFWLNPKEMNFTENEAFCRSSNGFLAVIPDRDVFDTVQSLRNSYGTTMADYYLGYTELEGDLYTLSGILHTFSNFASTQPDSVSENCVTIYGSTGIYYDESCSAKHFGVCSSIPNSAKSHQETTNAITTTTIPSSSIVDTNCICSCSMTYDLNPKVNLTAEQEAEIKEIKRNLTVEKSTLSSSVRRRTSAPDDRRSSQTIGLFGICFLTLTFGFLVFADCIRAIDLINCQQRHDIFTFH